MYTHFYRYHKYYDLHLACEACGIKEGFWLTGKMLSNLRYDKVDIYLIIFVLTLNDYMVN